MIENENSEGHEAEEYVGLADFVAERDEQLSFSVGDKLKVHDRSSNVWWWAELQGQFGYVPSSYLHQTAEDEEDAWQDDEYFGNYGTLRLHLEMLSDKPRTETYRQVILKNSAALRGKVVMDLGCGTGVISLFCARLAQPAAVYAVEASTMAEHTEELVRQNGCEGVVTVFQDRAENLTLPGKVDVLVSEWMGNCLLFEYMVESVLLARDRWLKEGGMMWPSSACLTVVPCQAFSDYRQKVEFWEKPYGLDFSYLQITHWKQTLFMLDAPVTVEEGDSIVGSIRLQRNPIWRRHLSITFSWNINSTEVSKVQTKCFPMWRRPKDPSINFFSKQNLFSLFADIQSEVHKHDTTIFTL